MQEKSFYFLVEISLICENVMSVMSEGLTSAASESTMRLIRGSVTATRELSAIKGCDLSTRATYLRVYTVFTWQKAVFTAHRVVFPHPPNVF